MSGKAKARRQKKGHREDSGEETAPVPTGQIDVLNVGRGHLEVRFSEGDRIEMERARRMVTDLLRRGYALFIEVDGALTPVRGFDERRSMYIVGDVPGTSRGLDDGPALTGSDTTPVEPEPAERTCLRCRRAKHRGRCKREVPMATARATAIGRTAGG